MEAKVRELARLHDRDPDELVEWWSERAAIREVDGGASRTDAEAAAFEEVRDLVSERRGPMRAGSVPGTKRHAADGD